MEIKRHRYLEQLLRKMDNDMIKVITGIRRSGKSYLLFHLFQDYLIDQGVKEENIISVSLDEEDNAVYRDPAKLYEYIKSRLISNDKYYVFLDEVQFAISKEEMKNKDKPIRIYGVLNSLLRKNNVDVYVTGSNSKFLSTDVMTEFRGRGDEIHIAPLSFSEYYPAHGGSKEEAWTDYLYYGGLPYVLKLQTDEDKTKYLERLCDELYIRDIIERYDIKNEAGLRALIKVLASGTGSLTNPQKIADTFTSSGQKEISLPTITNYMKYLQEAFVFEKAERYDIKGRKYISTPSKYYSTDIGVRNAFLNFRQFEETHLMENVIYNELIYRGYHVDVGIVEITENSDGRRKRKQLEVDFVANKGNRRYYVQSAYALPDQEKIDQEQASLIRIPDSFRKIIVVKQNMKPWVNENGILFVNVFDFLLNENSLEILA